MRVRNPGKHARHVRFGEIPGNLLYRFAQWQNDFERFLREELQKKITIVWIMHSRSAPMPAITLYAACGRDTRGRIDHVDILAMHFRDEPSGLRPMVVKNEDFHVTQIARRRERRSLRHLSARQVRT